MATTHGPQVGHFSKKDSDFANDQLIAYERALFQDGRPYSHYSETINLCSAACPSIRRLLQPAWDLAFAWLREEPPEHHTAMPWQIAVALTTVGVVYGWTALAGVIALSWAGLARIGEVLAARRSDLVFSEDTGEHAGYVLLTVLEPKTRFKSARHQCLRVDQPQFLRVLRLAFCSLNCYRL